MARFGWTEKEVVEGFSTKGLSLFLDFLGIRDRVTANKQPQQPKPKPTMEGNRLVFRPRGSH